MTERCTEEQHSATTEPSCRNLPRCKKSNFSPKTINYLEVMQEVEVTK